MSKRDLGGLSGLFNPEELLAAVAKETGGQDVSILDTPALHALCTSLAEAGNELHFIGRNRAQRMLVETLIKRIRVANHLQKHPEIAAQELKSPIFLVGPFRTGTTLLHRLLALDPAHRTPRLWETLQAPPAEPEYQGDARYFELDYRLKVARRYIDARERYTPDLAAIHPSGTDLPEECFGLLETSLRSHSFMFYAPVNSYLEWLESCSDKDWLETYALYADQLRLLQWWWPAERWALKTPYHLWALGALCTTFPDSLVVQQHRDPIACVASFCSLMAAAYAPLTVAVDYQQVGRIAMRFLRGALARTVAARHSRPDHRFLDVQYTDLVADPMAIVRSIYAAADLELAPAAEQHMSEWLSQQAASRKGKKHEYRLADYGVEEDEVEEAFADYAHLAVAQ